MTRKTGVVIEATRNGKRKKNNYFMANFVLTTWVER